MNERNFEIRFDAVENHLVVRLFGTRDDTRVNRFIGTFLEHYGAQPSRSVLLDLREAEFPEPLFRFVERFSMIANLCPRSRVAVLVRDTQNPVSLLLSQALRAACHDVTLTDDQSEAASFLASRRRPGERCLAPASATARPDVLKFAS